MGTNRLGWACDELNVGGGFLSSYCIPCRCVEHTRCSVPKEHFLHLQATLLRGLLTQLHANDELNMGRGGGGGGGGGGVCEPSRQFKQIV